MCRHVSWEGGGGILDLESFIHVNMGLTVTKTRRTRLTGK